MNTFMYTYDPVKCTRTRTNTRHPYTLFLTDSPLEMSSYAPVESVAGSAGAGWCLVVYLAPAALLAGLT